MISLLQSLNNDLPNGNVLILIFSIYSLVNKKVLLCKWILESETQNISILRKPPQIFWFSSMLISFWSCLFNKKKYFFWLISILLLTLWTLGWTLKTFSTFSREFALLLLPSFRSKFLVILIKKLSTIVASCFLFEARLSFFLWRSLFQFNHLLLKYGLIVFQNFLLSYRYLRFKLWK